MFQQDIQTHSDALSHLAFQIYSSWALCIYPHVKETRRNSSHWWCSFMSKSNKEQYVVSLRYPLFRKKAFLWAVSLAPCFITLFSPNKSRLRTTPQEAIFEESDIRRKMGSNVYLQLTTKRVVETGRKLHYPAYLAVCVVEYYYDNGPSWWPIPVRRNGPLDLPPWTATEV